VARLVTKQQTGVALLSLYITANGPSMARLRNAARAILARLVFANEKACVRYGWTLPCSKFRHDLGHSLNHLAILN